MRDSVVRGIDRVSIPNRDFHHGLLDSLCETVKGMDSEWTPALEQSWRDHLAPGIALITSLY